MNLLHRAALAVPLLFPCSPEAQPAAAHPHADRRVVSAVLANERRHMFDAFLAQQLSDDFPCRRGYAHLPSFGLGRPEDGDREMLFLEEMPQPVRTRSLAIMREVITKLLHDPVLRRAYPNLCLAIVPTHDVEKLVAAELGQVLPRRAPNQPRLPAFMHHEDTKNKGKASILVISVESLGGDLAPTFSRVAQFLNAAAAHADSNSASLSNVDRELLLNLESIAGSIRTLSILLEELRQQDPSAISPQDRDLIISMQSVIEANRAAYRLVEERLREKKGSHVPGKIGKR